LPYPIALEEPPEQTYLMLVAQAAKLSASPVSVWRWRYSVQYTSMGTQSDVHHVDGFELADQIYMKNCLSTI
jgi:hypothetical protein